MHRFIFIGVFAVSLIGAFFASSVQAQETGQVNLAVATPSASTPPVTAKNLPNYLDQDLANKHDDFTKFTKTKVSSLNANHRMSRSRMQVTQLPDGSVKGRYHAIDHTTISTKVRRSQSKSTPYVGVASYHEKVYEAVAANPEALRSADFTAVEIIPNRHIFRFAKGGWQ